MNVVSTRRSSYSHIHAICMCLLQNANSKAECHIINKAQERVSWRKSFQVVLKFIYCIKVWQIPCISWDFDQTWIQNNMKQVNTFFSNMNFFFSFFFVFFYWKTFLYNIFGLCFPLPRLLPNSPQQLVKGDPIRSRL